MVDPIITLVFAILFFVSLIGSMLYLTFMHQPASEDEAVGESVVGGVGAVERSDDMETGELAADTAGDDVVEPRDEDTDAGAEATGGPSDQVEEVPTDTGVDASDDGAADEANDATEGDQVQGGPAEQTGSENEETDGENAETVDEQSEADGENNEADGANSAADGDDAADEGEE